MRAPVQFQANVARVLQDHPDALLLEVGPGKALSGLAKLQLPRGLAGPARRGPLVAHTMRHPKASAEDVPVLLQAVAGLWEAGAPVDWTATLGAAGRAPLPTYSFDRVRCWPEPRDRSRPALLLPAAAAATADALASPAERSPTSAARWAPAREAPEQPPRRGEGSGISLYHLVVS